MGVTIYKLLIFGARDWNNLRAVEREFRKVLSRVKKEDPRTELVVISGGAAGADVHGEIVAIRNNCHVVRVDALWNTRRRGAGPQRNGIMAALQPDEAIGFHEQISKSKGTKDMKKKLDALGISNRIVKS